MLPDLSFLAGENADVPHLGYRIPERSDEGPEVDHRVHHLARGAIGEEDRVGLEQPLVLLQVHVVMAVELEAAAGIHDDRRGVVSRAALSPQERCVGWIKRRVGVAFAGEVVKPLGE